MALSIRTSWQSLRRQAAVARSVWFARGLRPWSLVFFFQLMQSECRSCSLYRVSRNVNNIYVCINLTSPPWQNTALNQVTGSSTMRPKF
jgi:hypothetical protein